MKRVILGLMLAVMMTGCGKADRQIASITGYSEICIGGVVYYQFTSGASVGYRTDGGIKLCR